MTFNEFTEAVVEKMAEYLPEYGLEGKVLGVKEVIKVGVPAHTGVYIEGGFSPIVNLNAAYETFSTDIESAARECLDVFAENLQSADVKRVSEIAQNCMTDYEAWKNRLFLAIANTEKSAEALRSVPHIEFFDLSIYCRVLLEEGMRDGEKVHETMVVTNEMLEKFGISKEDLFNEACGISEKTAPAFMLDLGSAVGQQETPALVLTNEMSHYGAAAFFYTGKMAEIGQRFNCNYAILPSSIHELVLTPVKDEVDLRNLVRTVRGINASDAVSEEDFLSDNIYYFNEATGEITMIS